MNWNRPRKETLELLRVTALTEGELAEIRGKIPPRVDPSPRS